MIGEFPPLFSIWLISRIFRSSLMQESLMDETTSACLIPVNPRLYLTKAPQPSLMVEQKPWTGQETTEKWLIASEEN